jgi:ABC-2 type transport system ATP-binding protein
MSTALQLQAVNKHFGETHAVADLDLAVTSGTFLGLLGRNGAGKSTLIKMITGLMQPTSGSIEVLGRSHAKAPLEIKSRLGVMPEGTALLERLTGPQYLRLVGRLHGIEDEVIDQRRQELFDLLELAPGRRTLIADYSYGMQKKTAFCAALLHGPELLLLDEPFEGIDPVTTRTIKDLLLNLNKGGTTIVLTSHALDLVERLCPQLALIHEGKLVGHGSLDDLRQEHGDAESLESLFLKMLGSERSGELSW